MNPSQLSSLSRDWLHLVGKAHPRASCRQWLAASGTDLLVLYAGRMRLLVCATSASGACVWRRVHLLLARSDAGGDGGDSASAAAADDASAGDDAECDVVRLALNADASLLLLVTARRACCVVELNQRFYHELRLRTPADCDGAAPLTCRSYALGDYWHSTHAALRVVDARWHPLALDRCAVLTSDNALRLYDASAPARAAECEALFRVQLPAPLQLVAFAYGHDGGTKEAWREAWGLFAVYFLASDARLYALCPVVPRSCVLPAHLLAELRDSTRLHERAEQAECARLWLRRSTGRVVASSVRVRADDQSADWVRFEAASDELPALQGPLSAAPASPLHATALECVSGGAPTVLTVAYGSGVVHALVGIEPVQPRWQLAASRETLPPPPPLLLHLYEQLDLALDVPVALQRSGHTVLLQRIGGADDALLALHGDGAHLVRLRWLAALRRWCRDALLGGAQALALPDAPASLVRGVLLGSPLLGAVALLSLAATDDSLVGLAAESGLCAVPLRLDQRERGAGANPQPPTAAAAPADDGELTALMRRLEQQTLASTAYEAPYEAFSARPPSPLPHFVVPPEATDYSAPSTLAFVAAQSAALRRRIADTQRLAGDVEARRTFLESVVVEQATELAEVDAAQRRAVDASAALDQKLERVQRTHATLLERSHAVLTILNACQAGLSDAEIDWHSELRDKLRNIENLKRTLWRLNEQTRDIERTRQHDAPPAIAISERQASGVAVLLERQAAEIDMALTRLSRLGREVS